MPRSKRSKLGQSILNEYYIFCLKTVPSIVNQGLQKDKGTQKCHDD